MHPCVEPTQQRCWKPIFHSRDTTKNTLTWLEALGAGLAFVNHSQQNPRTQLRKHVIRTFVIHLYFNTLKPHENHILQQCLINICHFDSNIHIFLPENANDKNPGPVLVFFDAEQETIMIQLALQRCPNIQFWFQINALSLRKMLLNLSSQKQSIV